MKNFFVLCTLLFVLSCNSQMFSNKSDNSSGYKNETLGIEVNLPEIWNVFDSKKTAPEPFKTFFSKKNKYSVLFLGSCEKTQAFSRCMIEKVPMDIEDYFALLYSVNKDGMDVLSAKLYEKKQVIVWEYRVYTGKIPIVFYETVVIHNGYSFRFGFWTIEALYTKYKEKFRENTEEIQFLVDGKWQKKIADLKNDLHKENLSFVEITKKKEKNIAGCLNGNGNMLWRVEGGSNTVFLFGSIHLGKADFYPLNLPIESAFDSSKFLVLELNTKSEDFKAKAPQLLKAGTLEGKMKINQIISPHIYAKLEEKIKSFGLPIEKFISFKPWMLAVTLTTLQMQVLGYIPDYGVENYFIDKAKNKEILELETFELQKNLFGKINGGDFLAYTLFELNSLESNAEKIVSAWRCGDADKLEQILLKNNSTNEKDLKYIYEELFYKRNVTMADKIETYCKGDGNYFVVVGAGHLVGEKGIVKLLENKGLRVDKI